MCPHQEWARFLDMGRRTVALHISPRLFREALSRALRPHVDVVIVPDCPDEQRAWRDQQGDVDLAIISGIDGASQVDAPVVVEVAVADGSHVGHVTGAAADTVRSLEELLALLPDDEDATTG